jgi:hypothetical protein
MTAPVIAKCRVGRQGRSLALFNLIDPKSLLFFALSIPLLAQTTLRVSTLTGSSPNDTNESGLLIAPHLSMLTNPLEVTLPAYSEAALNLNTVANSCTPLNSPAYGPFPAVVNGIDAVDWGVARVQWTSTSMPVSLQRIQFARAAEWTANPGVYPHTQGLQSYAPYTTTTTPQGWILSNLLPGTTYHVAGQSYDGNTWCTAPDVTFTTLPYPGIVIPQMPAQVANVSSVPTVTGTDYLYGSTCGTSGSVQSRLQDCLNRAQAGDGIGIPPGLYNTGGLQIPNNPNAVPFTLTGSTINSTAHGLSNGQLIRFSSDNMYGGYTTPAPLQSGVTYKVINATANTFQASYDGVTALALTTSGSGNLFYLKWPPATSYLLMHSTAPGSQLPPPGVRFDPVAYGSQVPNLQLNDPNRSIFAPGVFMSYYWFQNIEFSTDPTIATQDSGNGVDPPDFAVPVSTNSDNDHIVFNQGAILPAPPPSRSFYLALNGSNIVYTNSVIEGFDFWQIYRGIQNSSTTATTYTIPAGSVYWVGASGTKQSCTVASPQSLTFTGGTVGNFAIWIDPTNCRVNAQLQTGLTASGSSFTITTVAALNYPTYSWVGPNSTFTLLNVLPVGTGTVSSGAVSFGDFDMTSSQNTESGIGLHVGNGPGPFLIQNNLILGTGVTGTYLSDDITSGTGPCGGVGGLPACPPMYNTGDLTERRNTIRANPCYWAGSPCWNGGNYYWRNADEVKQGKNVWQDGNVWGPLYTQIAQGECIVHVTFTAEFSYSTNFLDYADSSNWNFTNNTCQQTPEIVDSATNYTATSPTYPLSHLRIHNNLFYQDNAYAQTVNTLPPAFGSVVSYANSQGACPYGKILQIGGAGDDFQFDHNTIYGQGGCQTWFYNQFAVLNSGNVFTNNIFNLVSDPGTWNVYLATGTLYQSNVSLNPGSSTSDSPNCSGFQASALFACMNYFTWQNNVVLATWTDSHPGATVDYTNAQITTAAALFPNSPATYFPSAGATMSDRVKQVSWFNPSNGNFRLSKSSPYISGARASTDGLDVGVDMDALEAAQGKVSNVHTYATTSTSTTIGFLAPDSFGCTVDWGSTNFVSGSGSYTRVANAGGQRVQNVPLSALPADSLIYYRVNCAVQQPTGSLKLP